MSSRITLGAVLAVALLIPLGCKQQEGDVCQRYPNRESDCDEGLICCGTPQVCPGETLPTIRGICTPSGMCDDDVEPVCADAGVAVDAGDAAAPDAATDAGPTDGGPTDGGPTDAGPTDAGPADAGPADAGPADAGPADAGPADAGTDAGTGDAGPDAG